MLSHATAQDWLIPYADGMLSNDERQRIDGHVAGCLACRHELGALRELNLALVSLPAAPPIAFAPFWLRLQAALPRVPKPASAPRPTFYRRAGLAFAAASFAALAAASCAFAAESALPDSPLYSLKHGEESVRLALTPAPKRFEVELAIASERLREGQVMASTGKPRLAAKTLRAFRLLIPSIRTGLNEGADRRVAHDRLHSLDIQLAGVQEANATRGDDDAEVKQLVLTSLDDLDLESGVAQPQVVPTASVPAPTASPLSSAKPTAKPTHRPDPKPSDD
jgi:hypothetical protein